jgi:hypothetical protein
MIGIVNVRSTLALAAVVGGAIAQGTPGAPTQGAAATAQAQAQAPAPAYAPARWNEDYSYLKNAPRSDLFDPIKYVPLGVDDWYLSLGGQLRYRYEYFNNFNFSPPPPAPPQDEDGYHLTRILLHGDVHFGKNLRLFAQGKSAMEDGREGGPRPVDADEIDVQQLFVDFKLPFGEKTGAMFRIGRQDLIYGAQRFISPLDWTNTRRTFEGGKVAVTLSPTLAIDGFWVHPVNVEKEELNWADKDTNFYGLYATLGMPNVLEGGGTKIEVYGLALNRTNALFAANATTPGGGDEDRYTIGARFSSAPKPWDFDLEADYQLGQFEDLDISAWSVAAELGYTLAKVPASPRLYVGFDYASGDDDPNDDELNTFNQLFPLGHAYFGYIDVIGRQNIIDIHPGLELTPIQNARYVKKLTLRGDYHLFWRASDDDAVYNVSGGGGSAPPVAGILRGDSGSDETFIGSEFDVLLTWQVDRHLQVYGGYSHFFTGDFIDDTGANRDIDFLYMAVIYTF